MKISVITVSRNNAGTIGDTLRSVAAQRHPAIEHLVIDGASTDGTLDVVRRVGRHVTHLVSEPDRGIYDAMNKGLRLATGDLVGFLNADDLLADDLAVTRLAEAALGADAVYGDLEYVRAADTSQVVRWWRSGSFEPAALRRGWMPPHPTFYIRPAAMRGEGFDTGLRIAADYDFMLRHLTQPGLRVAYVPHVLVRMRTGGASNRSLRAVLRKMDEDRRVMQRHGVGGWLTLAGKNLGKLPQLVLRRPG